MSFLSITPNGTKLHADRLKLKYMTTYFEITDKELREVYELLTKEQLIEALIRKHKECRDIAKNCVIPAVIK